MTLVVETPSWQGPRTPPSQRPYTALPSTVMRLRSLSPQMLLKSLGAASLLVVAPPWLLPPWTLPPTIRPPQE